MVLSASGGESKRCGKESGFMDKCGYYWSSTEYNEEEAYMLYFSEFKSGSLADFEKVNGYSVKCIKE